MFNSKIIIESFRRCKEPALLYSVFFLPSLLIPVEPRGTEFNNPRFLCFTFLTAILQGFLILYILRSIGSRSLVQYGFVPFRANHLLWSVIGFGFLILVLMGASFFVSLLPDTIQQPLTPPVRWIFTNYLWFPLLILSLGASAFFEELFFRGYLFEELKSNGISSPASGFITTLLFSLGHGAQGEAGILLAFVLGAVLLLLRIKTGSIWVTTLTHCLYNFTVLLIGTTLYKSLAPTV